MSWPEMLAPNELPYYMYNERTREILCLTSVGQISGQ